MRDVGIFAIAAIACANPGAPVMREPVGGPCEMGSDCDSFSCAPESVGGSPGGLCFGACTPGEPPPEGYVCLPTSTGTGVLFVRCAEGDPPCREGFVCHPGVDPPEPRCITVCSSDAQCETGHCDLYSGYCQTQAASGAGVGGACAQDSDCLSGVCLGPSATWTDGFCNSWCERTGRVCPDGAFCARFDGPTLTSGRCFPRCTSPADCRTGYQCVTTSSGDHYCSPPT